MKIRPHQIDYIQECIDKYVEQHKKAKYEKYHALRDVFISELRCLQVLINDIEIKE